MNKAFYIVGIVFSVIFMMVGAYYAEEVSSAKWNSYFAASYSSYSDYGYNYSYDYTADDDLTVSAGLWSVFFILSFVAIDLLGLLKVKTKTVKILSIIGLSLSGIFLLWSFGVIASPGSISFDEVYPAWALYCLTMLAFTIVGLVQSIRFSRSRSAIPSANSQQVQSKDLLDS
jgi:hypothetical protein